MKNPHTSYKIKHIEILNKKKTWSKIWVSQENVTLAKLKVIVHRFCRSKIPCHSFYNFPSYSSFLCHFLTSTKLSCSESWRHDRTIKCFHTYLTFGLSKKVAPTVRKNYIKDCTTLPFIYQTLAFFFDSLLLVKWKLLICTLFKIF